MGPRCWLLCALLWLICCVLAGVLVEIQHCDAPIDLLVYANAHRLIYFIFGSQPRLPPAVIRPGPLHGPSRVEVPLHADPEVE